jgi:hypothetical protein
MEDYGSFRVGQRPYFGDSDGHHVQHLQAHCSQVQVQMHLALLKFAQQKTRANFLKQQMRMQAVRPIAQCLPDVGHQRLSARQAPSGQARREPCHEAGAARGYTGS